MLKKAIKYDRDALHKRVIYTCLLMWFCLIVLVFRYGWLQIVSNEKYSNMALSLASADYSVQTPRGRILDRNGRELAISRMAKSLCVNPSKVRDPHEIAYALAPVIGVPVEEILEDIEIGGNFVWIKRQMELDEEKAAAELIKANKWDCLDFREEVKRYYPNDMLAANVLGFVGVDDKGLDGIEQQLDSVIKGGAAAEEAANSGEKNEVKVLSDIFVNKRIGNSPCRDVTLTLDANIQFIVEQALERTMYSTGAKAVTAIVMDPRNGDILAMASRPSYNPNEFWEYPPEDWRNKAVSFIYEPGSTFKAMVAGAALQEKVVAPNQWYDDPGYIMVSEKRIQNWNGDSFGTVTFTDIVKNSINTGFAQVGLEMGGEKLTEYAKLFGFGDYTGIDLPGEECGILFDPDDMRASDIATMSIGHSIAVTPLQLVTAMSAVANDGVLLKPNIVKQISNGDGTIYRDSGRTEVRRVIESATDKTLVGLLEEVVATGGGAKAGVQGYRIAGKTGTAQKIREDGVGYLEDRYIASFCGFAPVENPQITLLVMIDDPRGEFYGGQIAAPVAAEIFTLLFRYLHIEPSSDPFMDWEQHKPKQQPVQQIPEPVGAIPTVPEGKVLMPDMRGKSIREAAQILGSLGISMNIDGSGVCTAQEIAPYTVVDPGISVTVYFTSP